ncbi:unnamed protein product [Lactuca virosa]|uniref:Uncharacterized protein n=1 Tax=Lactuca virosa TaxID=75947 RepID=A0AAU9LEB2_9ASTR|nr:unnamed protein product [Lactuca virosa]
MDFRTSIKSRDDLGFRLYEQSTYNEYKSISPSFRHLKAKIIVANSPSGSFLTTTTDSHSPNNGGHSRHRQKHRNMENQETHQSTGSSTWQWNKHDFSHHATT